MFKNKKRAIIILALGTVLLFDGYLLFGKLLANIIVRSVHIRTLAVEKKSIEEDRAHRAEYQRHSDELTSRVMKTSGFFYRKEEIPIFLERISQMAKKSGIDILNITPIIDEKDKEADEKLYEEMPIKVTAKGGYHELGAFLSDVETNSKFMRISGLQISHDIESIWRHDVRLIVSTFILLDGGNEGAVDARG